MNAMLSGLAELGSTIFGPLNSPVLSYDPGGTTVPLGYSFQVTTPACRVGGPTPCVPFAHDVTLPPCPPGSNADYFGNCTAPFFPDLGAGAGATGAGGTGTPPSRPPLALPPDPGITTPPAGLSLFGLSTAGTLLLLGGAAFLLFGKGRH